MPTKGEKDAFTGQTLRDHEWDGIRELDFPLPRWWLYLFIGTIIWSIGYAVMFPAVPWLTGYSSGLLGFSSRERVAEQIAEAHQLHAGARDQIATLSFEEIQTDPELTRIALAGGNAAFADNCAACHGAGGAGQSGGYPVLADDAWIWGGTLDDIHQTIRHGIRWESDLDTRIAEMPAFGVDYLSREEIEAVTEYVLSLSDRQTTPALIAAGGETYANECASCHGDDGTGLAELGAPDLTDAIWLYGSEKPAVIAQISRPQHGVMPAWSPRLDDATIKMLTLYVHSLGGGR